MAWGARRPHYAQSRLIFSFERMGGYERQRVVVRPPAGIRGHPRVHLSIIVGTIHCRFFMSAAPEYSPPNRLREIAVGERPQERLEKHGASALSDTELLAMLLRSGTRGQDVLTLASRLIADAGSLAALVSWRPAEFGKLRGHWPGEIQLITVAKSRATSSSNRWATLRCSTACRADCDIPATFCVRAGCRKILGALPQPEENRLVKRVEISSGTATTALAHPREVFRAAIRESAAAIVCIHNHPSGDPAPSAPDLHVTRAGSARDAKAVDIDLIDHVIVGRVGADPLGRGYFSFRDAGML